MFEKNENADQMTNVGESLQLSSPLLSDCMNRQKLQSQRKLEIIYFYKYFSIADYLFLGSLQKVNKRHW